MKDINYQNSIFRIQKIQFNHHDRIDIRRFFQVEGKWIPTKKGVNLPYELKEQLLEALKQL